MKKLPVITTPTYRGVIPSTGKPFEFKPFLVGEQKILLMALESGDINQIYLAFRDVVNACVITPKDHLLKGIRNSEGGLENLSSFDVESIFIQISSKSVGELSKIYLKCSSCEKDNLVSLNLNEIELKNHSKGDSNQQSNFTKTIMLTETVGVKMRYPSMKSLYEEPETTASSSSMTDEEGEKNESSDKNIIQKTIRASIECIFDESEIYLLEDVEQEELDSFFDSLSLEQNAKIESFFETVPYLALDAKFECEHCKAKNELEVKGLKSFF